MTLSPATYACTSTYCASTPSNGPTSVTFKALQAELNRVRPLYGLAPNVVVDGKIGNTTLAMLIKTAQAIGNALGMQADSALDDYIHWDISSVGFRDLAQDADSVLTSLRRNGKDPRYAGLPGGILDPYGGTPIPPGTQLPPTSIPIGPTAITPTPSVPIPMPPQALPTTSFAKVAGIGAGVVAGVGALIAIVVAVKGHR